MDPPPPAVFLEARESWGSSEFHCWIQDELVVLLLEISSEGAADDASSSLCELEERDERRGSAPEPPPDVRSAMGSEAEVDKKSMKRRRRRKGVERSGIEIMELWKDSSDSFTVESAMVII